MGQTIKQIRDLPAAGVIVRPKSVLDVDNLG